MKIHISKVEDKSPDWKVVGILNEQNVATENVSVNRIQRDGSTFPDFDNIKPGADIEAYPWRNPSNKWYLFPPKEAPNSDSEVKTTYTPNPSYSRGGGGVRAAQERKNDMIEKAQDNKSTAIMIASAFRDATLMLNAQYDDLTKETDLDIRLESIKDFHKLLKDWYIREWKATEKEHEN